MSGLRVATALPPSLSSGSTGDPAKSNPGDNAAFAGVLNRVATQPTVADPKSSQESVGQAFSGKRARADSGSDEPDTETLDEVPPASTATSAGTATLDISALAQAALTPTAPAVPQLAKTPAAGPNAASEAGPAIAGSETVAAALQAIVQQPGRAASSGNPINQTAGSLPAQPTGTDGRTSLQTAATTLASTTGASDGSKVRTETEEAASHSVAASSSAAVVIAASGTSGPMAGTSTAPGAGAASNTSAPTISELATGALGAQSQSEADTKPKDGGAPQSSQPPSDAAQAAAVAATPQLPQSATSLEAPAPAASAVRPASQTSTRPSPTAPLRAGTKGVGKSAPPETSPTASPASSDSASGKRGKDKLLASTVVAAASNDPSVVATPAQQVVTALQSLGKDVAETAARHSAGTTTASADAGPPQSAGTSSLKTLTINLNPGHLGPVSITMRLQADTMEIRIAVSNPDTLHLLDKDKHLLTAAVEAMGGSHENLQIGTLGQTSGSGDSASTGGQNQNTPGRQDAASSDTSSNGRQAQGQNRSTLQDTNQSDADDPTATPSLPPARGLDGSLYL
ncbi:flagellar hook-length control protein FliK [Lichenifustis flavocetrariae]|uniref:Flagellar hook-length control protein FliK n=1 Tax=Lichenifustis flavocetrariae TaxID=2949735 RepID=A0AA41YWZ5_9HYPH|nr:flagellar hook-length control protein FliK [Lichenifustis flavocetrariae]MCW6508533.1 flagellar hook-length control protein FliK [Lichenifustis flavocetrariae]